MAYLGPAEKGMKANGDRPWLFSGLNLRGLKTWSDTDTIVPW